MNERTISAPGYSPWGNIDHREKFAAGIYFVSTPGHGGMMIHRDCPRMRDLTDYTRQHAERYRDWLCWEEDCAWALPAFELRDLWPAIFSGKTLVEQPGGEGKSIDLFLRESISSYHGDYFDATATPGRVESCYARWLEWRERDRRHASHDPDLIISCVGDWHKDVPAGAVGVTTADMKFHLITAASHRNSRFPLHLLSESELWTEPLDAAA